MFAYYMPGMPYHFSIHIYLLHVMVTYHEAHESIMKSFPGLVLLRPRIVKLFFKLLLINNGNPMRQDYTILVTS